MGAIICPISILWIIGFAISVVTICRWIKFGRVSGYTGCVLLYGTLIWPLLLIGWFILAIKDKIWPQYFSRGDRSAIRAGWSDLSREEYNAARRAMAKYFKEHPACELTGHSVKKDLAVHHIIPIWANPSLAADPRNFITLASKVNIHLLFGHDGNYATKYTPNIKEVSENVRMALSELAVSHRRP